MTKFSMAIAATFLAVPAFAESHASGDPAAGADAFSQCQACHVVRNDAGETLAGRNAKSGPNLWAIAGSKAGAVEGFRYGKSIVEAGEAGLVWDEANFVAYVSDPTGFLRTYLDDSKARGKMSFRVRKEEDAVNLYAYLASLAPTN